VETKLKHQKIVFINVIKTDAINKIKTRQTAQKEKKKKQNLIKLIKPMYKPKLSFIMLCSF